MDQIAEQNSQSYNSQAHAWDVTFSNNVAYKYLERPAMKKLLPQDLEYKDVLSIGVGAGDELVEIIKQNPKRVVGIDISEKLLEITKKKFPSVETIQMDMMELNFPDNSFDLIYSSLAFHYSSDWDALMSKIYKILKSNGFLLFSTHHPGFWGNKEQIGSVTNERGVRLTTHKTILHAGVEATYFNHPNTESILESVTHAGLKVLESQAPKVIQTNVPSWEKDEYSNLVKRLEEYLMYYVVKAQK